MRPTFAGCPTSKWFGPHRIWVDDNDNDNDNNVAVDGHDQVVSPSNSLSLSLILVRFRLIMCFRLPDSFNYDFRCRGEQLSAEHRVCPANWAGWATHTCSLLQLLDCYVLPDRSLHKDKQRKNGQEMEKHWQQTSLGQQIELEFEGFLGKLCRLSLLIFSYIFFFQVINHELWAIISITQQAVTF